MCWWMICHQMSQFDDIRLNSKFCSIIHFLMGFFFFFFFEKKDQSQLFFLGASASLLCMAPSFVAEATVTHPPVSRVGRSSSPTTDATSLCVPSPQQSPLMATSAATLMPPTSSKTTASRGHLAPASTHAPSASRRRSESSTRSRQTNADHVLSQQKNISITQLRVRSCGNSPASKPVLVYSPYNLATSACERLTVTSSTPNQNPGTVASLSPTPHLSPGSLNTTPGTIANGYFMARRLSPSATIATPPRSTFMVPYRGGGSSGPSSSSATSTVPNTGRSLKIDSSPPFKIYSGQNRSAGNRTMLALTYPTSLKTTSKITPNRIKIWSSGPHSSGPLDLLTFQESRTCGLCCRRQYAQQQTNSSSPETLPSRESRPSSPATLAPNVGNCWHRCETVAAAAETPVLTSSQNKACKSFGFRLYSYEGYTP